MRFLTLQQVADYLKSAETERKIDQGHAIIHIGKTIAGVAFVLVNNCNGESMLTEAL